MCYRINYRSLERTLTNEESNEMHQKVREKLVGELGVELR
jgi:phenylalanyl-tRNA synthetase alpha chain